MFCINCGKPHNEEGYLCPECAAAKAGQAAVPQEAPVAVPQEAPVAVPQEAPAAVPQEAPAAQAAVTPELPPVVEEDAPSVQELAAPQKLREEPKTQMTPGFTLSTPVDAPKKKNIGLILLIALLGIALIGGAVALVLNWDKIFSTEAKLPEDPAEYVAFLEEPRMQAISNDLTAAYSNLKKTSDAGAAMKLHTDIHLGDSLAVMLKQALASSGVEMDVAWLQNITLDTQAQATADARRMAYSLILGLGSNQLITVDMAMDLENAVAYIALPELTDQYAKVSLGDQIPDIEKLVALSRDFTEALPGEESFKALVDGLGSIVMKYTKDATRETATITAGKAQKEVTVLNVRISEEQLAQLIGEMLEFVDKDEAANQIARAYIRYQNEVNSLMGLEDRLETDALHTFLQEGMDTMKQLAQEADEENYLLLRTYVDGTQIYGRSLEVYSGTDKGMDISCKLLPQENVTYLEAVAVTSEATVRCTGEGTVNSGLHDWELSVLVDDVSYVELELEDVDAATGYGTYRLIPTAKLMEAMELDATAAAFASALSIQLTLEEDAGTLAIITGNAELLSYRVAVEVGQCTGIDLPADGLDISDEQQLNQFVKSMNLDKVAQNLKNSGLPETYHGIVDMAVAEGNKALAAGILPEEGFYGTWSGGVDMAPMLNQELNSQMEGEYFSFHDLTLTLTLTFDEAGNYTLTADKAAAQKLFDDIKAQMVPGMRKMLEEQLAGTGVTVDQALAMLGKTLEQLIDESMDASLVDQLTAELETSGTYEVVDETVLEMDGTAHDYILDGTSLTIYAPQGQEDSFVYPLELTKAE